MRTRVPGFVGIRLGFFFPKFLKFHDYRNLTTSRKQVIVLTMSIQEINKSLVFINLVGSQHKTQSLEDY